jgi:hypothetical protein
MMVLVCEAEPTGDSSAELRVIDGLLNGSRLHGGILVEGAGGRSGLRAVVQHLQGKPGNRVVASVRDRDYDSVEVAEASLRDGELRFVWRRHEIENYLVEPPVVLRALDDLRTSVQGRPHGVPAWAANLPQTRAEIETALADCALRLAPREALNATLWGLGGELDQAGEVRVGLAAGSEPLSAAECETRLKAECERVSGALGARGACPGLDPEEAVRRFRDVLASMESSSYTDSGQHLLDFGGKELVAGLADWLRIERGVGYLTNLGFLGLLADALLAVYHAEPPLFEPDDFRDIVTAMREAIPPSGLP